MSESPGSGSSDAYFEMWFADTDAGSAEWTVPVTVDTGKGRYTYTFTKGGSGGGHKHT